MVAAAALLPVLPGHPVSAPDTDGDKEEQTWHDKIAITVVVPVQYYPVASWP